LLGSSGSLATAVNALMAHYNSSNRTDYNFWKNPILQKARTALDGVLKEMHSFSEDDLVHILKSDHCNMTTPDGLNKRIYILISMQLGCRISCIKEMEWEWFEDSKWKNEKGEIASLMIPAYPDKNHQGGIKLILKELRILFGRL